MAHDAPAAREVFTTPHETIPLDWFEGPVQAVYVHDAHGPWYVFALPSESARDRLFCMRPFADPAVAEGLADVQTLEDADWLERFGREELLPACLPIGFEVRRLDGVVVAVVPMTDAALEAAVPRLANAIAGSFAP
ncbi:MAG: hypothetical protein R3F61_31260 [Myxococcota bacterium]